MLSSRTYGEMTAKRSTLKTFKFCGERAARDGLRYFWVDSCCINKEIKAELSQAEVLVRLLEVFTKSFRH
jgi:hypothetical protein